VNETAIKQAVRAGARSLRELSFATGCGTQCGSCVELAREVMDQALADSGSPKSTVELEVVSSN
jgi:bacterioferritin-associated ferredoxin